MALEKVNQIQQIAPQGTARPVQAPVADVTAPLDQFVAGVSGLSVGSSGRLGSSLWTSAPKGPGAEIVADAAFSTMTGLRNRRSGIVDKIQDLARESRGLKG